MTPHRRRGRHRLPALCLPAILAIMVHAPAASAAEDETPARLTVRFAAADVHDQYGARRLLARIGDAALEVCGASPFSLAELQRLIRASPCWHDAVARAVTSIDAPQLAAAYNAEQHLPPPDAYAALRTSRSAAGP